MLSGRLTHHSEKGVERIETIFSRSDRRFGVSSGCMVLHTGGIPAAAFAGLRFSFFPVFRTDAVRSIERCEVCA